MLSRQKYIQPLVVPDPSSFEVEIAVAKLKRYKSPGSDEIPAELIKILCSKIHKLINSIWNKEELSDQWKSIIVPVQLSTSIFFSRPYIGEIIGDHHHGFWHNRSTTYQIFYIRQTLRKKWDYNETVYQLLIDFKEACDSVRREVLYNILIEFGIPMKLVRLIKMCLNEMYGEAHIRFESVAEFRYLGTTMTNQTLIQEEIKRRLNSGDTCCLKT
jgi:hypothetical protein